MFRLTLRRLVPCLAVLLALHARAALVDGVVATVDNEAILHSDLVEEAGPLLASLRRNAASEEQFRQEADKAIREALDQAIERKLLYRQAQLAGMSVTDEQVEDRLNMIRKEYGSDAQFQEMTQEAGAMTEFRERLRQQVMALSMARSKQTQFEKEAVVSESELRQYFQDHMDQFANQERVKVSRIFLTAGTDPAERQKARAQLEALKDELALGADFAQLAREHSQGPDAANGGEVGWVIRGDLVPELESAAFSLEQGQVSDVIETEFGFSIVKVEEKAAAGTPEYDQVRTQIEPELRKQYAQERYKKWVEELRKRSRVTVYL